MARDGRVRGIRDRGGISAHWRRAPFVLRHHVSILVAVLAAALLVGLTASSAPFLSTAAGSAALKNRLNELDPLTTGVEIQRDGGATPTESATAVEKRLDAGVAKIAARVGSLGAPVKTLELADGAGHRREGQRLRRDRRHGAHRRARPRQGARPGAGPRASSSPTRPPRRCTSIQAARSVCRRHRSTRPSRTRPGPGRRHLPRARLRARGAVLGQLRREDLPGQSRRTGADPVRVREPRRAPRPAGEAPGQAASRPPTSFPSIRRHLTLSGARALDQRVAALSHRADRRQDRSRPAGRLPVRRRQLAHGGDHAGRRQHQRDLAGRHAALGHRDRDRARGGRDRRGVRGAAPADRGGVDGRARRARRRLLGPHRARGAAPGDRRSERRPRARRRCDRALRPGGHGRRRDLPLRGRTHRARRADRARPAGRGGRRLVPAPARHVGRLAPPAALLPVGADRDRDRRLPLHRHPRRRRPREERRLRDRAPDPRRVRVPAPARRGGDGDRRPAVPVRAAARVPARPRPADAALHRGAAPRGGARPARRPDGGARGLVRRVLLCRDGQRVAEAVDAREGLHRLRERRAGAGRPVGDRAAQLPVPDHVRRATPTAPPSSARERDVGRRADGRPEDAGRRDPLAERLGHAAGRPDARARSRTVPAASRDRLGQRPGLAALDHDPGNALPDPDHRSPARLPRHDDEPAVRHLDGVARDGGEEAAHRGPAARDLAQLHLGQGPARHAREGARGPGPRHRLRDLDRLVPEGPADPARDAHVLLRADRRARRGADRARRARPVPPGPAAVAADRLGARPPDGPLGGQRDPVALPRARRRSCSPRPSSASASPRRWRRRSSSTSTCCPTSCRRRSSVVPWSVAALLCVALLAVAAIAAAITSVLSRRTDVSEELRVA